MAQPKNVLRNANLGAVAAQALGQLQELQRKLAAFGLSSLTTDDRKHSNGRFREGEEEAAQAILNTIEKSPALFSSLAPLDHGKDANVVEVGPSRDALERRKTLAPLAEALEKLLQLINDDLLATGQAVKDLTVPAYAIIKVNAGVNRDVKNAASAALDFYNAPARKRAATRKPKSPTS